MQLEARVESEGPTMLHDVGHCPQGPLVLIARRHGAALLAAARSFCEQNGHLRAELGQFKGAGKEGDDGSCRGTSGAKAGYRVEIRVRPRAVDVLQDIVSEVSLDPAGVDMFCSLIDGK